MIKTHLNNICSRILSFTLTDIFLNAFSAKTSIQNRHLKTTSNQKKEARFRNNFEKVRKRAPKSQLSGTSCKMGHPNVLVHPFLATNHFLIPFNLSICKQGLTEYVYNVNGAFSDKIRSLSNSRPAFQDVSRVYHGSMLLQCQ